MLQCPKCQARHDLAARAPGERFDCTCGHGLRAPKPARSWWLAALLVVAGLAIPCVLGLIAIPDFAAYQPRAKAQEARMNLQGIRAAELSYFEEHQAFVAVGPVPVAVPSRVKVAFVADEGFQALQWWPEGAVYHQYEVRVTGPRKAVATARGDVDGDGQIAEYRLLLDVDDPRTGVEALHPETF